MKRIYIPRLKILHTCNCGADPARGAYSAPPGPLAGCRGQGKGQMGEGRDKAGEGKGGRSGRGEE